MVISRRPESAASSESAPGPIRTTAPAMTTTSAAAILSSRRNGLLKRPSTLEPQYVDVEIRLFARWRELPPRHCSAPHCAERRRDADPDSYRPSRLACWQVPF